MSPVLMLFEEEKPSWAEEEWGYSAAAEKCRLWAVGLCRLARGHDWYLEIDPWDGVTLSCRKCPAGINDLYPDGSDLLYGSFPVCTGYVLWLSCGTVEVNGQWHDGFMYGWRGPVTAMVHTEKHYSWDYGSSEYDAYIEVEPRDS